MCSLLQNSRIEELHSSFKEARERISRIKSELICYKDIDSDIEIPSINEIRYVVYHTLKGLNEANIERKDEEFRRAIRHCQRASYDILEIGVTDKIEYFRDFSYKYRKINISDIIKDWSKYQKKVSKINIDLAEISRSEYSSGEYHKLVEEKYKEMCAIVNALDNSKEEIYKKIRAYRWDIFKVTASILFTMTSLLLLGKRFLIIYSIDVAELYFRAATWFDNLISQKTM